MATHNLMGIQLLRLKLATLVCAVIYFRYRRNPTIFTCRPTLLTLSNKLVTTLHDSLIDGSTINSVLDSPTILFDFNNLLVDSGVH
jgi:hypothetical protein